jgi:hypothetical protein
MARLVITNGIEQGRTLRLRPGLNRIGRNLENHFQISDPSISGVHCEVFLSEGGLIVRDMESTNGTAIDGVPIREANLYPGQVLHLGNLELRAEMAEAPETGPAIQIPEMRVSQSPASLSMPDGSPACSNHPTIAGSYRCTQCQVVLCPACVRVVRRIAGDTMVFCTLCTGSCELLLPEEPPSPALTPKRNLFGRITQALHLSTRP